MLWSGDGHGHSIYWAREISKKDSYRPDITVSLTGTSLFAYAIKLLCTEWNTLLCEKLGLFNSPLDYCFITDALLNGIVIQQ